MDARSSTPNHDLRVSEAPRLHRYGAHGPWPFILATLLFMKFGWYAKLYYSLIRGDLAGTPAHLFHNTVSPSHPPVRVPLPSPAPQEIHRQAGLNNTPQFLIHLGVVSVEILSYPGMQVFSRARNFRWPSGPPMFFAQAFLWSMNDVVICIMAFICLHRLPPTISPDTPGYDPSALREYRAWRSVDLPLFGLLNMFSALTIVVDCTTWMYWEFERQGRARKVTELRDLRMRRMFGSGERHEGMVTGVVQNGEEGPKEEGEEELPRLTQV